ncbi:MAG: hypothetical protein JSW70_02710 [Syntrophobacterales bacterium]|nr:MAG: hypothetical protein JSW70_02710 [Syntrophobacterales bacterium]
MKGTNSIDKVGQFLSDIPFLVGFGENSHTHAIGDNVYTGKTNPHAVIINASPHEVYPLRVDSRAIQRWCPQNKIIVEKIIPGKFGLGINMRYRLNCYINPVWNSIVLNLEENR